MYSCSSTVTCSGLHCLLLMSTAVPPPFGLAALYEVSFSPCENWIERRWSLKYIPAATFWWNTLFYPRQSWFVFISVPIHPYIINTTVYFCVITERKHGRKSKVYVWNADCTRRTGQNHCDIIHGFSESDFEMSPSLYLCSMLQMGQMNKPTLCQSQCNFSCFNIVYVNYVWL